MQKQTAKKEERMCFFWEKGALFVRELKKLELFFGVSVSVIFLMSCGKASTGKSGLVEIDVSIQYPVKELCLQDIAKVEYIPLETNDNTLMRSWAQIVHVSDDYIIASNTSDGDVFVFNGKGKSKISFNHKGQGPMHYNHIQSIAFDEKAKEIFIFDRFSVHPQFLVYAENGDYKRTLACPSDFLARDVFDFDEATLLVYDDYGLNQDSYSPKPYLFISKKDGRVVDTLNIFVPVRVSNRVILEVEVNGEKALAPLTLSIPNNCSYGKNFLIADWSSDTIYRLTPQKELLPMIVRTPPVQNSDPKIVISNGLATDQFILFGKALFDFEMVKKSRTFPSIDLIYDFKTGQINEYKLINKDFESLNVSFRSTRTPENTGVDLLDVGRLFEADEAGKIKGELKQLLKSLDEEDNPILMKVKF